MPRTSYNPLYAFLKHNMEELSPVFNGGDIKFRETSEGTEYSVVELPNGQPSVTLANKTYRLASHHISIFQNYTGYSAIGDFYVRF